MSMEESSKVRGLEGQDAEHDASDELPPPGMKRAAPRVVQGEHLPLAFVVDVASCERRAHMRHVTPAGVPAPWPEDLPDDDERFGGRKAPAEGASHVRRVAVADDDLGVTGVLDLVRPDPEGPEFVVLPAGDGLPDAPGPRAAVASLVLALARCIDPDVAGVLERHGDGLRPVESCDDMEAARALVRRAAEVAASPRAPLVRSPDPLCESCRYSEICLPDETAFLASGAPGPAAPDRVRRLVPARDDRRPLHVQEQGATVGVSQGRLVVRKKREVLEELPLSEVSAVHVHGNVQVTTQALRTCLAESIPVFLFTGSGWLVGRLAPEPPANVPLRLAQTRLLDDADACLAAARRTVCDKLHNARVFLRRNARADVGDALRALARLERQASRCDDLDRLRGLEGAGARAYFQAWNACLDPARGFVADGRSRRPPRDPINALLSYAYGVLVRDWVLACHIVGLDPLVGFYHRPLWGRPALALDLMEPARPWVADSVVLRLVNNGEVTPADFEHGAGVVHMAPRARKALLRAYEQRADQLFTHPVLGYRISIRRCFEVQARLFGRWLLGEIPRYPAIRIR